MPCSICKLIGHTKKKCPTISTPENTLTNMVLVEEGVQAPLVASKPLKTEDTGKIFEMAICLAYGIPYDGKYKYGLDKPELLKPRLARLTELFPACSHTAKKGARYDFTALEDGSKHLSAKSTKKGVGKVAPQVIGQCQPQKFCQVLECPFTTIPELKQHIQQNILQILPVLVAHSFDSPTIYYNEEKNTITYITLDRPIDWPAFEYSWTCDWTTWANSSSLKINVAGKSVALLEFQFHTKSRSNMAIRWCYETFLDIFKDNLTMVAL